MITNVKTYKDMDSKYKHEYLIATAKYDDNVIYVRLERRVRKSEAKEAQEALTSRTPPSQPSNPHETPTSPDDSEPSPDNGTAPAADDPLKQRRIKKLASDDVSFWSKLSMDKAELVDAIEFKESDCFSLPELIVLAQCVHSFAIGYSLLFQNCFFFAQVMCEALKKLCPSYIVPQVKSKIKRGTWHGFPANNFYNLSAQSMVTTVVDEFPQAWKKFDDKASHVYYVSQAN